MTAMKKMTLIFGLAAVALFVGSVAFASPDAGAVATGIGTSPSVILDPTEAPADYAKLVYEAVKGSNWALVAALVVFGTVAAAKKFGKRWLPVLGTHVAGAVLTVALAGVAAVVNAGLAGELGVEALLVGLRVAAIAAVPYLMAMDPAGPLAPKKKPADSIVTK